MAGFVSRVVACLVAVVVVLQLIHLVLLNKLENTRLQELHHFQKQQQLQHFPLNNRNDFEPDKSDSDRKGNNNYKRDSNPLDWGNWRPVRSAGLPETSQTEIGFHQLLHEDQGVVMDSTGEFRIVFDVAGPHSSISLDLPQNVIERDAFISASATNPQVDDFSIDDENVDGIPPPMDVTLVTYGDYHDIVQFLIPLVSHWNGPISVAVYASNSDEIHEILKFISRTQRCYSEARQFISFHLVFPLAETHSNFNKFSSNKSDVNHEKMPILQKRLSTSNNSSLRKTCQSLRDQINKYYMNGRVVSESIKKYDGIPDGHSLPTNLLRNVARRRVVTEYSFVSNVNMLPSANLRSMFQQFVRDRLAEKMGGGAGADAKKTVYVVPAFEIKFEEQIPLRKQELLALVDKHKARPFQYDMCWKCQMYTDYEAWQKDRNPRGGKFGVLFEVLWRDPWQPFFISDNSVPLFDERFMYNGVSRMSQLCEMHIAGYKFAVLNEAFLVHRGYTKLLQKSSDDKSSNVDLSRAQFRQFKTEMKDKYPHSTRRCY